MTDSPPNPPQSSRLWAVLALAGVGALGLLLAARGRAPGQGLVAVLGRDGPRIALLAAAAALYAAPTLIAWRRQHRDVLALGALNLFLGWTFVGWVAALVWAVMAAESPRADRNGGSPESPDSPPASGPH